MPQAIERQNQCAREPPNGFKLLDPWARRRMARRSRAAKAMVSTEAATLLIVDDSAENLYVLSESRLGRDGVRSGAHAPERSWLACQGIHEGRASLGLLLRLIRSTNEHGNRVQLFGYVESRCMTASGNFGYLQQSSLTRAAILHLIDGFRQNQI